MGGPEEGHRLSKDPLDRAPSVVDLTSRLSRPDGAQVGVVHRVRSDGVPVRNYALDDGGVGLGAITNDEERRMRSGFLEDVEEHRREQRMGSIVKSESDAAAGDGVIGA